ncbi:ubiquitin-like domain-containing protein [Virgibacillus ainsalahensis]
MKLIHKLMPASKMKLVISSSIGVLALVLFAGFVLFEATKAEVVISDNGEKQTVDTHTNTVEELLTEVGIAVGEHDTLSHDLDAMVEGGMEIDYKTAKNISVTIDGQEQEYYTTADTIEEFLAENSLSFAAHDDISHEGTEATEDGLHIEVNQAYEVTINDGGKEKTVWSTGGSVEDVLNENKIKLNEVDQIKPAISEDVTKDTDISIVRVETKTDKVTEKVAFETETKEDNSLPKGEENVISQGQEGKVAKKYEVTYENGEEVDRELISEEVLEEGANRVVAIGTMEPEPAEVPEQNLVTLSNEKPKSDVKQKTAAKSTDKKETTKKAKSSDQNENVQTTKMSNSNKTESKPSGEKVYTMTASAYTAFCDGCSGYTATGIDLNANPNKKVIAVDPNVIPLGSRVWVEGYGEAIASDTGGHIVGNRIDIHVPTKSEAYAWGKKTVQVKVLD